jgi:DNA-binding response OmpR family regulator
MTFAIIEKEEPILGQLIALAFESAGHDCLVLKDGTHAARVLRAIRLDSIVVDIQMPGMNGVDWLEAMITRWPDLPSRTLLLTHAALTDREAVRIKTLGAEVVFRPLSIESVRRLVLRRLQKAGSKSLGASRRDQAQGPHALLLN